MPSEREGLQALATVADAMAVAAIQDLRARAEAAAGEAAAATAADTDSPADLAATMHELRVHQIELELQNEELRDAKVDLDSARERYFDLYDLAPVGYCSLDAAGRIVEGNLSAASLLGVSRAALVGKDFAHFISRRDRDNFHLHARHLLADAEADPRAIELRLRREDRSEFWAQLIVSSAPGSAGAQAMRIVLSDVSERRRVQDELREQKEFFHRIAENIGDFIAVTDLRGRRLYSSPSYRKFLGDTRELVGTDSFADVHPQDRERVRRAFQASVRTGIGEQLEYRLLLADGSVRDIESSGSLLKDSEGRIARVLIVSRDITERKQLETQIRKLAFHDPLTQLPNRRLLLDRLSHAKATSKRSGCHAAMLFIDLDNFKWLNDNEGHEAGDALLVEVAERLTRCVRAVDTVARFGGDEFLVMISELAVDRDESMAQAGIVAEKIRSALADPYDLVIRREEQPDALFRHQCSASIGVTLFINHDANCSEILKQADIAMYEAKAAGRNTIRFHAAAV